jgi:hypothetical protein
MRKTISYVGTLLLILILLSGCGKLERKGPDPVNAPPKVYFSNIPEEETYFSQNQKIYWFGTDMDGFVTAYQYAVVVKDSLMGMGGLDQVRSFLQNIPADSASWVNQTTLSDILGFHAQAAYGGHQQNVRMFASMEASIYTPQYVFLRAVDNEGKVSEVIYRMYFRNNHRPEAVFEVDSTFSDETYFCLEDTTATWKGITITWKGEDLIDYPDLRNQPKFLFKWILVGPFSEEPTPETVDTTKVFSYSLDSILIAGEWKESRWMSENSYVFTGLENYPGSIFGWYQLRLWAQDDAFVSNDLASTLNLRIIQPTFRYADKDKKTILIVDATAYGGRAGGPPLDTTLGLVRPFYQVAMESLSQQGLCDGWGLWYDASVTPDQSPKLNPDKDLESQYDLLVVLNVGSKSTIERLNREAYQEYLNIGGRVMFIGLNNYLAESRSRLMPVPAFWTDYVGIEKAFSRTFSLMDKDSTCLEFIEAQSFGSWNDLPNLVVDKELCHKLLGYSTEKAALRFGEKGIPYVCFQALSNEPDFAHRIPYERRMFTFISVYGSLSAMHNMPCALNFIGPTFRTMDFAFPLNLMKNDAPDYPALTVMKKAVEWFWEDLP